MITYMVSRELLRCDLLQSEAQALVNTVNCYGRMGKGLALQFKKRYPDMNRKYEAQCAAKQWKPGSIYKHDLPDGRCIINASTKNYYGNPSELPWIDMILEKFVQKYQEWGITSVAFPKLGCGNGGLDWNEVGPRMIKALSDLPISIEIYINEGDQLFYLADSTGKSREELIAYATMKRDESTFDMQLSAWNSVLDGLIDYELEPRDIVEVLNNLAWTSYERNAYQEFLQFARS